MTEQHKPALPMTRQLLCTVVFAMLLLTYGCSTPAAPERQKIKFTVIEHSQVSGFTFQKLLHIRTAEDFEDLWTIHSQPTRSPAPNIDFTTQMVLAVFYGQTQTGGFDIYIHDIEETETELLVNVRTVQPPPSSMRAMMITQPNMIVSLAKSEKPVRFIHEQVNR